MSGAKRKSISLWSVNYGEGSPSRDAAIPHAWNQDVSVEYEGPVTYQTFLEVPREPARLVFHGVSYSAEVSINDVTVASHSGIWDAFEVPLEPWKGKRVDVKVKVLKNGGATYPVKNVASGFLPFVFHTFGGLFGAVELVTGDDEQAPTNNRVRVEGGKILVDDKPFYVRGLLHWGWYPELGHPNPGEETIRREVRAAKELGFNLVKFCLWIPPHRYLEILKEEGLEAWMELPLWDPTPEAEHQDNIAREIERIVRQYRHHDNIIIWTAGCELSASTSPEYRQVLTQTIKNLTGCPLVKDNSGGAEMYGGDLREFGEFYDFHPYCDTPFYPAVLDSLMPGPRKKQPILLGEFNDIDVHRDLSRIGDEMPYWASSLPELNGQGVRWQYDLPNVMATCRFANHPTKSGHSALMESSRRKALFMRKTIQEWVRARDPIGGYVITGWRDTPISSAGFFDDWEEPRFSPSEVASWNGPTVLFLIPSRRPPWTNGGNRMGYVDPLNHFTGQVFWRIGVHSEHDLSGGLVWKVTAADGSVAARGALPTQSVSALESVEVGEISWQCDVPGEYRLELEFGDTKNEWPIWVVSRPTFSGWTKVDPLGLLDGVEFGEGPNIVSTRLLPDLKEKLDSGANVLLLLTDEGTVPAPFWRESAYQFSGDLWDKVPFVEEWSRLLAVSGDRVLALDGLDFEVSMNRIDVRTYAEAPVLVRAKTKGTVIATTLRPFGGLGNQPAGVGRNPAGAALLVGLLGSFS